MNQDTRTLNRIQQAAARALTADELGVGVIYMLEKSGIRVTGFSSGHRISKIVGWDIVELAHFDPLLSAHDEVVNAVTEAMTNADS